MVAVDSTGNPIQLKRRGKGAKHRQRKRNRLRRKSVRLVKTGRVEITPCIACGSTENLTIHHVPPIRPDRFVFLCKSCHLLVHKPIFRTIEVCVAEGHFSILPHAVLGPKEEVPRG
ncbi:MAG: hypothetical protein PVJ57_22605 [Phycisphaerae bacterium]|jgi:hypothetical protein